MKLRLNLLIMILGFGIIIDVSANDCEVTVDSSDNMRFDTDHIEMKSSCDEFTVKLTHSGSLAKNVMGHNWVLTLEDDMQGVVQDGASAGLESDYVKAGDKRVIAHTVIIGGGEETSITFDVTGLSKNNNYRFFCSFPGHFALMTGVFVVQ